MKKKRKKTTAGAKSRDKARAQNTGENKESSGNRSAMHVALLDGFDQRDYLEGTSEKSAPPGNEE